MEEFFALEIFDAHVQLQFVTKVQLAYWKFCV